MKREKGNAAVWILIILVIVGAIWWMKRDSGVTPLTDTQTQENSNGADYTPNPLTSTSTEATTTTWTIKYSSAGFEPKSLTIKKGDMVTWVNNTTHNMWIASAMHPTHMAYDGTSLSQHCSMMPSSSFDQCKSGSTYSFTFNKVGSWNYHDHATTGMYGTVVVTE